MPGLRPLAVVPLFAGCAYFTDPKQTDTGRRAGSTWTPTDTGAPVGPDTGTTDSPTCPQPAGPISLAEAWDRDWARIWFDGTFNIENFGPHEIEMERWHLFFTPMSQDTAAGSADIDYASGTATGLVVPPGDRWSHTYTSAAGPAWWCVERTQQTTFAEDFRFTGARVPTPLMTFIHTQTDTNGNAIEDHVDFPEPFNSAPMTQFNVWDAISEGPVMAVGRLENYIEMTVGETRTLTVEVVNLGRGTGTMRVGETIPAGTSASGFTIIPESSEQNSDGSTTIWWEFKMPGSVDDPDTSQPTEYDIIEIEYDLSIDAAECGQRHTTWAPQVLWEDIWGRPFTSYGTPLVIACCE